MGGRLVASLAASAFALSVTSVGAEPAPTSPPAAPDSVAVSVAERRCEALADRFEARSTEMRARSGSERNVVLLEAEEIAEVADELVAEGDVDLAASLFEEALALLEPSETPP